MFAICRASHVKAEPYAGRKRRCSGLAAHGTRHQIPSSSQSPHLSLCMSQSHTHTLSLSLSLSLYLSISAPVSVPASVSVAPPAEPRGEKKLFFVQILGGEKLLKFGEKWAVKKF